MIPLHTHPRSRRDSDPQSNTDESPSCTAVSSTARKAPSIQSAAKARVYKWSRRIMITTESLWLKKIRRNKFKAFLYIFLPSAFIFLLAFTLAPPRMSSNSNNLMFFMGGVLRPDIVFTSGVIPKRIHSARDSFDVRYTPLLAALGYGASSIEIYVWLEKGVLCAGTKDPDSDGKMGQSLDALYLSKLRWILESANENLPKVGRPRGVFQTAPYLPLQLVMNIESGGPATFQALGDALLPFLQEGWLTTADATNLTAPLNQSALTVIVTGNIQVSSILGPPPPNPQNPPPPPTLPGLPSPPNPIRYVFFDAPLMKLGDNPMLTPSVSPMASAPFSSVVGSRWVIPKLARKRILEYVGMAHGRGIAVRITKPIDFPMWLRNMYWQMLLDCGVDWLDVDDLYSAGQF